MASADTTTKESYLHLLREQLITKEDPQHVHKTLGILCVISYIYRFANFPNMAFDTHPELTVPTVILHFVLSASSFIFRIPAKRIRDGSRIWPEYRWHSCIFASRSLALILLYWYEQHFHLKPMYWMNVVIQLAFIGMADLASQYSGKYQSNSVRDCAVSGYYKFFFSAVQLRAAAAILLGVRKFAWNYYLVFVIQTAAFQGTMNRKNLTKPAWTAVFYALQLTGGVMIGYMEFSKPWINFILHGAIANTATVLRMGPRLPEPFDMLQSKYAIWLMMGLILPYVRPNEDGTFPEGGPTEQQIKAYAALSLVGLVLTAIWKIPRYPKVETYYSKKSE